MASKLNIAEAVKRQSSEEILNKRRKTLVQRCFEYPELNHEVLMQLLNKKIEWSDELKTVRAAVENIQTMFFKENKDVRTQVKQFIQQCFENPQTNHEVLTAFLNRKILWEEINTCILHGEIVKCKLCGETSITKFWCDPCIHKDWCCYCCILLGIPFYR